MKLLLATLFLTLSSVNAFAGACDTNVASFQRNLDSRCGSLSGAARSSCAQREYDALSDSIKRMCPRLDDVRRGF